jgi:predicted dehydrogenase
MARKLKVGLVGLGNIGRTHMEILNSTENVELVGICDRIVERADEYAKQYGTTAYYSHSELFEKSGLEAVVIAVPHYDHPQISIDAFNKGIHVLLEKPIAVHVKDSRLTLEAYEAAQQQYPGLTFGLMFQERTLPYYKKIKEIVASGELGQLVRATWINTEWFRSQSYYDSGGWRATWAGEGGGILTNQCPHNLDFYQWVFGVPNRISGHVHIGKYHSIEVEDEVTAYFEHENGMVGHFVVTTAESPGTNRIEIVGEYGRLVYENKKLVFYRNYVSMLKFLKESKDGFANVDFSEVEIELASAGDFQSSHRIVTEVFVNKLLNGSGDLVAEGTDGIKSVVISNGIMLSSFTGRTVDVPYDEEAYLEILNNNVKNSKFVKNVDKNHSVVMDVSTSFTK